MTRYEWILCCLAYWGEIGLPPQVLLALRMAPGGGGPRRVSCSHLKCRSLC